MPDQAVATEILASGVGLLTLTRPDRLNAISDEVIDGIRAAVEHFTEQPEVRALVVTGAGKAFCAGADIAAMSQLDGPWAFEAFLARLGLALDAIAACPKPSVAALHGPVLGGGLELAMACDIRIADTTARLGLPEIKLGLLPGGGGTVRLPRLVGPSVARTMLLTGDPLEPDEAARLGLIARTVDAGGDRDAAIQLATQLASLPPRALASAKVLLDASLSGPEAMEFERKVVALLFATEDQEEGFAAFLAKRAASFTGK